MAAERYLTQDTAAYDQNIDHPAGPATLARVTRWLHWARRVGFGRRLTFALSVAAAIAGVVTGLVLTGPAGFEVGPGGVLALLVVDMVLLLALGGSVTWVLVRLWAARRAGAAGARIHVRLVTLFAVLAVVPAITVVSLAAIFFNFEVRTWFNERVRTAVTESVLVAEAYLNEHKRAINGDVLAMANDLSRDWTRIVSNRRYGAQAINSQAALRVLSEAIIFDTSGNTVARTRLAFALELDRPPFWAIEQAREGQVVIQTNQNEDRVRALVRLDTVPEAFLYVGRSVDPKVLGHMQRTQRAADQYKLLESRRAGIQWTLASIFVLVALLLLFTAVGTGLLFANRLAGPISSLIEAAGRVRAGDLTVRIPTADSSDELGTLTRAFNRMTEQLEEQREELTEANRQLDERRQFTEAVLGGVSAGVIGLDRNGVVNLPNKSALALLGTTHGALVGRPLRDAVPEMKSLIAKARRNVRRSAEAQISLTRGGSVRTLLASAVAEKDENGQIVGFVVTFDDVTELLSAQRKAAWADVARRIAHEMKNPLTPIQLSAERLKRKYLSEITSDPETFAQCTDTIVRQVSDIGRMVDEFSSFARMPRAVMQDEDLGTICRQALLLHRSAHPEVSFTLKLHEEAIRWRCDRRLISQALTNLIKNGIEAIEGRDQDTKQPPGRIEVCVDAAEPEPRIDVADNGKGLPAKERDRLTEPYVTTRAKGTGLGLAIVHKIMEDHGGTVVLSERAGGGAVVSLVFGHQPPQQQSLTN